MPFRTGARLLVDQLLIQGVNHAFTVPGESFLPVLDALYDSREMVKLIVNRHESGATFMAEAYAKLTGQPGVAFVPAPGDQRRDRRSRCTSGLVAADLVHRSGR